MTIPFDYPLWKQCDAQWGSDIMVTKTVCSVGCLMSSTSMGLAGTIIPIHEDNDSSNKGVQANPGTLNEWLNDNGGYDSTNDMYESVVPKIDPSRITWPADGMHRTNDLPFSTVSEYISKGRIVIGNVMNGGHFVLLTGFSSDGDTFAVNDPGFATESYSYSKDIVGYRIFDMARSSE